MGTFSLFGNETAEKTLKKLASCKRVTPNAMARELQIPLNMVQNQLERLCQGGWLVPVFEGNKKMYYWNPHFPLVRPLREFLKKMISLKACSFTDPREDPAYGLHLPLKERIRLSEELTREGEKLSPYSPPKPFVKAFDSIHKYEKWKKKQTNPWLL